MAESFDDPEVFWVDPEKRGILPLDGFHISRSLRKRLFSGVYQFSTNRIFEQVVKNCAERAQTWINPEIFQLYMQLHRKGFAHSVEVWRAGTLVGGLYGVAIGGAFFGESMFSKATDGSKLALVALVARLNAGGFQLLDTQFSTAHLVTMGGIEVSRNTYQEYLETALGIPADFATLASDVSPQELWQLSTQTS